MNQNKFRKTALMNLHLEGTLIAALVTKNKIYLLSDGRVIVKETGQVHDNFSKIHKITNQVGMLTAGRYLPPLEQDIIQNCNTRNISYVDEVPKIASSALEMSWDTLSLKINDSEKLKAIRVFIFIVGFDKNSQPHMFYLDNMSQPRFSVQERMLFQSGKDVEIGALSTGSGEVVDPSAIITKYIKLLLKSRSRQINLANIICSAFDKAKNELSLNNQQIGGKTFFAEIDTRDGYKDFSG